MTTLKSILGLSLVVVFALSIVFNFAGCSKTNPLSTNLSENDGEYSEITKDDEDKFKDKDVDGVNDYDYPQYGEGTWEWDKELGGYPSGSFKTQNGSKFKLKDLALVPPKENYTLKNPITITMAIELSDDGKELIYTFEPSGCIFEPMAEITLDYTLLDDAPSLYLIEDGEYLEQSGFQIDVKNKKITLYVSHFSRYSLIRR